MIGYLANRIMLMVPTLIGISLITFIIIQLPPGDFLSTMIAECEAQGESSCGEGRDVPRAVRPG
jgi:peptide/nickel transport system permease protein